MKEPKNIWNNIKDNRGEKKIKSRIREWNKRIEKIKGESNIINGKRYN